MTNTKKELQKEAISKVKEVLQSELNRLHSKKRFNKQVINNASKDQQIVKKEISELYKMIKSIKADAL